MSNPTSLLAYADCTEVWDRALNSEYGIRVKLVDYDKCINFRMRMHSARKLDREANMETYEPGSPKYGRSAWDPYKITILNENGVFYLRVERVTADHLEIEELEPDQSMIAHQPQLSLPPPVEDELEEAVVPDFVPPPGLRRL